MKILRLAAIVLGACVSLSAQIPATLGWYQVPNTSLAPVVPPDNAFGTTYPFFSQRQYIVDAWNSGAFDTKRNKYINWGGGHQGYAGNEFYRFDPEALTVERYNDPSIPLGNGALTSCGSNNGNIITPTTFACPEAIGPGTSGNNNGTTPAPNSRHTYDGEVYMPSVDRFFIYSGALQCGTGCTSPATWTFGFATNTWQRMNPANDLCSNPTFNCPNGFEQTTAAYDPTTQRVLVATIKDFWAYTYDSVNGGSYQKLGATQCCTGASVTSIVDPENKKWVMLGGGTAEMIDISAGSSYTKTTMVTSGGSAFINPIRPGLAWDPIQHRIVAWAGDNNVGLLDLKTMTWTTVSAYAGGPAVGAAGTGTFKRFQYSPKNNLFMVRTGTNLNMYTLRLTPESQSVFNFPDRCFAPGVKVCNGFDASSDIPNGDGTGSPATGTGIYAANNGTDFPVLETTTKASGAGSLKIRVPIPSGTNPGGFYRAIWNGPFSQNSTYYLQWRQYIPTAFYNINWSWKQTISSSTGGQTCDEVEMTTNSFLDAGPIRSPTGYTRCGSNNASYGAAFLEWIPNYVNCQSNSIGSPGCPTRYDEQGAYRVSSCIYGNHTGCYHYAQNVWITFYWKYTIGTWGSPNSHIEAWYAEPNQVAVKFVDIQNFVLSNDAPATKVGYNRVDLTNYMTGRNDQVAVETQTYFDELIVSSQTIDFPSGQSISASSPPPAPTNLRVVP